MPWINFISLKKRPKPPFSSNSFTPPKTINHWVHRLLKSHGTLEAIGTTPKAAAQPNQELRTQWLVTCARKSIPFHPFISQVHHGISHIFPFCLAENGDCYRWSAHTLSSIFCLICFQIHLWPGSFTSGLRSAAKSEVRKVRADLRWRGMTFLRAQLPDVHIQD